MSWNRHRTRRRAIALAAALVGLLLLPGVALGHAELKSSTPKANAKLNSPPATIALTFTDTLRNISHFEVIGSSGAVLAHGTVDAAQPTRMTADVSMLVNGKFTVEWTSVATDGDVLRGTFSFTVTGTTPPPASVTLPPVSGSAGGGPSGGATSAASSSAAATTDDSANSEPAASSSAEPGGDTSGAASSGDAAIPIVAALAVIGVIAVGLARRSMLRPRP